MPAVEEIADRVYRLETPTPGAFYVPVVYLIDGPKPVLIEPGPAAAIPSILEAMTYMGMERLHYIIPTHIHVDHGGGAGELARLFPQAKVLVHPRGANHLVSPSRLIQSTRLVWGDDFEERLGPIGSVPESRLIIPDNGQTISIGDRELQIIHAPGHSPHHIVILDRKLNGLFCGEALGLPGHQMPPVAPYSYDQEIYLDTIDNLRQLEVQMLFYSHGGVEKEPDRLMSRASENARVYSSMILEALKRGNKPEDIMRKVEDHARHHFGLRLEKRDLETVVAGYVIYFRSEGWVP
jgi:glyoxylase-like metal-dependent hydrolase (beta-lactamase superfamily II)